MVSYPTSAATNATLYIAVNSLQTNLTGAINAAVTTITLNSTTSFPTAGTVLIDSEIIHYTGVAGSDLTGCARGFDGTTAVSHLASSVVSFAIVADHHNVLKDETIAVETDLVAVQAALATLTPANTAASILERVRHIVTQIKNISGLTNWYDVFTSLPIAKGGTNSTTALGGNKAVMTNGTAIVESTVTATELGYLSGASSNIQTQINALSFPSGAMLDFGGTSAPTGWLACDGSSLLRAGTYAALFAAIGTTWGAADGTHFNIPDFARRVAVGSGGAGTGTLGNAVGNTGGAETHTLSSGEMPSHTHTQDAHAHTASDAGHTHGVTVYTNNGINGGNPFGISSGTVNGTKTSNSGSASITVNNTTATNQNTGGGGAHNNVQPSAVVLKIIKI